MKPEIFYNKVYDWVITIGPRIIAAIIILIIGILLIKLCQRWLKRVMVRREFDPTIFTFIISLIIAALHVLLVIAIMQVLGIEMTIFTALVAAMGVAAGLALSGTLQNFASGVLILLLKPFKAGDTIIAQGQEGVVSSIQIFYTVVTTFDNRTVIVPNSKLSNEIIINTSMEGVRRLDVELKFNYGIDFSTVKSIAEHTISNHRHLLKQPASKIGVSHLEPDGFKMSVSVWVDAHDFLDFKLDFQEKLMADLKNAGIKLPGM